MNSCSSNGWMWPLRRIFCLQFASLQSQAKNVRMTLKIRSMVTIRKTSISQNNCGYYTILSILYKLSHPSPGRLAIMWPSEERGRYCESKVLEKKKKNKRKKQLSNVHWEKEESWNLYPCGFDAGKSILNRFLHLPCNQKVIQNCGSLYDGLWVYVAWWTKWMPMMVVKTQTCNWDAPGTAGIWSDLIIAFVLSPLTQDHHHNNYSEAISWLFLIN